MIQKAFRYGLIAGVILTVYHALLYFMGMETFTNFWLLMVIYPVLIFMMVYYPIKIRNRDLGGVMSFGTAFQIIFIIASVATFVTTLWGLLLFNVIDPDLKQTLPPIIIEKTAETMERFGAPEASIEEALTEQAETLPEQFTPQGQLLSFLKSLLFYVVLSAIIALIVKRSRDRVTNTLDVP